MDTGRRRARVALLGLGALVLVMSRVLASPAGPDDGAAVRPVAARPTEGRAGEVVKKVPTYLPRGAKLVREAFVPDINGWSLSYSLPGKANRDTVDDQTFASGTGHPATLLRVVVVTSPDQLPAADPAFFDTSVVDVGGVAATLSVPRSGFGRHSLVWSDGRQAYRVSVERLRTADGTSGISVAELTRVAASLR